MEPFDIPGFTSGISPLKQAFNDARHKVGILDSVIGRNPPKLRYTIDAQAKHIVDVVNDTYDKLHTFAYEALLFQTRLKPYLNAVGCTLDQNGELVLDFEGVA